MEQVGKLKKQQTTVNTRLSISTRRRNRKSKKFIFYLLPVNKDKIYLLIKQKLKI